ncbi:MAG: acetate--CoA ligase family protein [Burkholderiales bacterium]|nr:acetate--CoA ligase family protein [Burkholderiales bacterium]
MSVSERGVIHSLPVPVDLRKLVSPASIAVVGASQDTKRVGGEIVLNLKAGGFRGDVFPVNPKYSEICGYSCFPGVTEIGKSADMAVVAVNAELVPNVIRQCGKAGISIAVVLSSGFGEAGASGIKLQRDLDDAIAESGVRIVGPNCIGLMNVRRHMYCGFGPGFRNHGLSKGPVAMVTQSGGYGFSVVGLCNHQGIGFSQIISTGNECDLSTADLIDYILDDDEIKVVVTYIEGVKDGRRLLEVGQKALACGKPILCWKVGNSVVARNAVASHTANLSAPYELFKTAFSGSGYIEIREIEDLVDIARGFLGGRIPRGRRVAVVTTSGGSGVLMADRCDEARLTLPEPPPALLESIRSMLPPHSAVTNPVDMTAQVGDDAASFNRVVKAFVDSPAYDQILVRYGAVQGVNAPAWATGMVAMAQATQKPVLVAWSRVPDTSSKALQILEEGGVPWFITPGRTVTAAAALGDFHCRQTKLQQSVVGPDEWFSKVPINLPPRTDALGEHASKQIIAAYGIPVVNERLFNLAEIENLEQSPFAFPLVVKIESPDIAHKTEAGAVITGIRSLPELRQAAGKVAASAKKHFPDAVIEGVLVQQTCSGMELILGGFVDDCFGPVVILGLGGIHAEVLKDVTRRFAPVSRASAREMIFELRAAPLFSGYRGMPPLDVEALADAIFRLAHLISHHKDQIREIDINPLFIGPAGTGVIAADALVIANIEQKAQ